MRRSRATSSPQFSPGLAKAFIYVNMDTIYCMETSDNPPSFAWLDQYFTRTRMPMREGLHTQSAKGERALEDLATNWPEAYQKMQSLANAVLREERHLERQIIVSHIGSDEADQLRRVFPVLCFSGKPSITALFIELAELDGPMKHVFSAITDHHVSEWSAPEHVHRALMHMANARRQRFSVEHPYGLGHDECSCTSKSAQ